MASSIEARVPFCYMPLFDIVNQFPHYIRAPGNDNKPLLKKIAEKYLPRDVVYRRKVGLTLPLEKWLRNPNGLGQYLEALEESNSELSNFGDRSQMRKVITRYRKGDDTLSMSLMILINVELWLRSLKSLN